MGFSHDMFYALNRRFLIYDVEVKLLIDLFPQ